MLLSYSGIRLFFDCPRAWAFKYLDKVELYSPVNIPMAKGKLFHALVENNSCVLPPEASAISQYDAAVVVSAARKYIETAHTLPQASMREVKIINEEKGFIGYADSITINPDNTWLVGEMKTSSKFDAVEWAINHVNLQTALYKAMSKEWCAQNFLMPEEFAGTSFKKIIFSGKKPLKGRGKNAVPETVEEYTERIKDDAKVYHQIFKVNEVQERCAIQTFDYVKEMTKHLGARSENYPKCNSHCKTSYGVCDYFEHCWGMNIEAENEGEIDYD